MVRRIREEIIDDDPKIIREREIVREPVIEREIVRDRNPTVIIEEDEDEE